MMIQIYPEIHVFSEKQGPYHLQRVHKHCWAHKRPNSDTPMQRYLAQLLLNSENEHVKVCRFFFFVYEKKYSPGMVRLSLK